MKSVKEKMAALQLRRADLVAISTSARLVYEYECLIQTNRRDTHLQPQTLVLSKDNLLLKLSQYFELETR